VIVRWLAATAAASAIMLAAVAPRAFLLIGPATVAAPAPLCLSYRPPTALPLPLTAANAVSPKC
jgi:hypothetical protein